MNYYNEIKTKLIENENYTKIKEYSKENHKVKIYFEIGKLLFDAGKHYGKYNKTIFSTITGRSR